MIRQRNDIQPVQMRHPRNIAGCHIIVPAGRQAGMHMEIVTESRHFKSSDAFTLAV